MKNYQHCLSLLSDVLVIRFDFEDCFFLLFLTHFSQFQAWRNGKVTDPVSRCQSCDGRWTTTKSSKGVLED
ncbi:hypothetical protein J4Q44_G00268910 [Coregonus suidteri]|uniref:Uncharacterized protein n=1 Tax=Coregonus suidteri TaxID=861788 RepID=A0AAN8LKC0_9TELE